MTPGGYPNRSEIRGGRRVLSLFLLAVFLPLLFPAEVWANLARPPLPELSPAATPSAEPTRRPCNLPDTQPEG